MHSSVGLSSGKPHTTGMQDHNHIQCNGNEIAVINHDGTPSHNSDLSVVPNWVLGWIKDKKLTESYLVPVHERATR